MRLESFHFLIEKLQEAYAKSNTIYALGVDLTNIEDPYSQIISHLLKIYYSEEGEDWISWFLYEKSYNPELEARDADGNEICYDVPSLWKHVEEIRVSSDFKEFIPKESKEILDFEEQINNMLKNYKE
jgi:hypothetical protein